MTRSIERCYGGCAGNLTASIDCPAEPTKVKDGGDRKGTSGASARNLLSATC